ncbi:major facilitator superfamily domain-containing protein [Aspergillus coremiiformis]|uniref:Major facilitator superfamily domain-containing protein n=1 Tax=Aspergillus coremiiformis TaxID=138285 RepID=A0A5N6YTI5_9EURO|nr:major facilitator superfamily domain-containing protein [Aspergillus coremiiformis]
MSLPRVSYLESWEHNPASFRRQDQPSVADSDDDAAYQDLPEEELSSSFPSTFSFPVSRQRLNFNPYAGPGWNEVSVDDSADDRSSLRRVPSQTPRPGQLGEVMGGDRMVQIGLVKPQEPSVLETTSAFEVGRAKRILQVCMAVIYCFLAAGVVFGFAALKPVLIREGVYHNLCSNEELNEPQNVCYPQELRLNLMFTIAAVATNVSALPVGTILDAYGPRVCGIIGSGFLTVGALLFGFSSSFGFDGYILGYLFLSLGGPFIFISSFHLSNTFPTRSGLILSMLTGAFDASSALFLIFRLINENTNGRFTTGKFFLAYLAVPVLILAAQLTIMPSTSYKTAGELVQQAEAEITAEAHDQVDDDIQDRNEGQRQRNDRRIQRQDIVNKIQDLLIDGAPDHASRPEDPVLRTNGGELDATSTKPQNTTGGVWGAMHGCSALQQVQSPWFALITVFTVLQMLRINYFVASIRQQYEFLFGSPEQARKINEVFDFFLPLGGLVSVPFIGAILDNASTPFVLLVLVSSATVIGVLGCISHSIEAGYTNIAIFVIYRPFYYTAVSDYAAKVFGFQTFGKVYGLIICLSGLGNFAQAGLDALTFKVFHRNPIPVNILLTLMTFLVGIGLVGFVWWQAGNLATTNPGTGALENGDLAVPIDHGGIETRDWEREPLLYRPPSNVARHAESPSYGISSPSSH